VSNGQYRTDILPLRIEGEGFLAPAKFASRIENMVLTADNTLATVIGPAKYDPYYDDTTWGNLHGIYHCVLMGGSRDVLLIQDGQYIKVHRGWSQDWQDLIGPEASGALLEMNIPDHQGNQFPLQCVSTPTGVVIIPHGGRASFYDGEVILPLGYDRRPGTPQALGPESNSASVTDANDSGYSINRTDLDGYQIMNYFGYGRVGTAYHNTTSDGSGGIATAGGVNNGQYQYAQQWIDYFGNLSPLSARSNTVTITTQTHSGDTPEKFLKQLCVQGLEDGPAGTIGKDLSRTKDMLNSGTLDLFSIPTSVSGATVSTYATLTDNVSRRYPDNVPDSWLITRPISPQPVPVFKLGCYAFGRFWYANTTSDPGILCASQPGRYGTFLAEDEMFPDATGSELMALCLTQQGMLAMTETSTYLISMDETGERFRSGTLDPEKGCAAPSSCANMPDGSVIWLGRDGFYQYQEGRIIYISEDIRAEFAALNLGRLRQATACFDPIHREYRCWVPINGDRLNSLCYVFDGSGWRRRTDIKATQVCVTKDHRKYTLAVGTSINSDGVAKKGVWVLDHETLSHVPATRTSIIETSWIEPFRSIEKRSPVEMNVWLREAYNGTATVHTYRDWRMVNPIVSDTTNLTLLAKHDTPPLYGTTTYNQMATPNQFVKNRAFWKKVPIEIASVDVYKVKISTTSPMEFIGVRFSERLHPGAGRME
jgi:hypothetical protein